MFSVKPSPLVRVQKFYRVPLAFRDVSISWKAEFDAVDNVTVLFNKTDIGAKFACKDDTI